MADNVSFQTILQAIQEMRQAVQAIQEMQKNMVTKDEMTEMKNEMKDEMTEMKSELTASIGVVAEMSLRGVVAKKYGDDYARSFKADSLSGLAKVSLSNL